MRFRLPAVFGLLMAICGVVAASPVRPVVTQQTRFFLVASEDPGSARFAAEAATLLESIAARYLALPDRYPQPITVSLVPDWPDPKTRWRVAPGEFGVVRVRLAWDGETTFAELAGGLTEGLLRRHAWFEAGQSGYEAVPSWIVDGMAHRLIAAARPRLAGMWASDLLGRVPAELDFLWDPDKKPDFRDGLDAYAALLILEEVVPLRDERRLLFQRLLLGRPVGAALQRRWEAHALQLGLTEDWINDAMESAPLEVSFGRVTAWHWERRLRTLLPRFESLAESEAFLDMLVRPPADPEGKVPGMIEIWERRLDAEVSAWVEARLVLLANRMETINPAYFNAARSLAILFQGLLRDTPRHRFVRDLSSALTDLEDARRLRRDMEQALRSSETLSERGSAAGQLRPER